MEDLTAMTEKFLQRQKQAYRDAKRLQELPGAAAAPIIAPCIALQADDTGAERHIICGKDHGHVRNRRPLLEAITLETANRETQVTEQGASCAGALTLLTASCAPQLHQAFCQQQC